MANLDKLPIELLQYIGTLALNWEDEQMQTETIAALRLVSKQMYDRSLWLFYRHHHHRFKNATFELSYDSLTKLLRLCSVPYFLDRLRKITFKAPNIDQGCYRWA
jgi:hypothetical protein